jgi:hypothetical protein
VNLDALVKMVDLELLVLVGSLVFKVVVARKVDKVHLVKLGKMASLVKLVNEDERDHTEARATLVNPEQLGV